MVILWVTNDSLCCEYFGKQGHEEGLVVHTSRVHTSSLPTSAPNLAPYAKGCFSPHPLGGPYSCATL
jgi:hypothetical protein